MTFQTEMRVGQAAAAEFVTNTWRPDGFKNGVPVDVEGYPLISNRALRTNAFLNREEWERLDEVIVARIEQEFQVIADIQAAGLTSSTTVAEWHSKWRVASEVPYADVNMDFETRVDEGAVDMKTYSVPIPIIAKKFSIGRRELISSRTHGSDLDTRNAEEAAKAVAEKLEYITINGWTDVSVAGNTIPGLRTLSSRYTDTADGDFGTISNIYPTFRKALAGMAAERYRGPFTVYMANNQYFEMLEHYSDGSSQTALQRVLTLPQITAIRRNDLMTDGEFVMVQMDSRVLDLRVAMDMETRQWDAADGSRMNFYIAMSAVVRLVTDYNGDAGIGHITGA
jgi:uncharacterized linocin/CFP29 family protein